MSQFLDKFNIFIYLLSLFSLHWIPMCYCRPARPPNRAMMKAYHAIEAQKAAPSDRRVMAVYCRHRDNKSGANAPRRVFPNNPKIQLSTNPPRRRPVTPSQSWSNPACRADSSRRSAAKAEVRRRRVKPSTVQMYSLIHELKTAERPVKPTLKDNICNTKYYTR